MFSLDNFYYILYKNFFQDAATLDIWFQEFGSVPIDKINIGAFSQSSGDLISKNSHIILFYDQEPLIPSVINDIINTLVLTPTGASPILVSFKNTNILANSEHSKFKIDFCRENRFYDWYYFFHGLAALEWFRDYQYVPKVENKFTKVFITLNHLVSKDRSYRLSLVANLLEKDLIKHGNVSCQLSDHHGTWKDEIFSPDSKLSVESKKRIFKEFSKLTHPLTLDKVRTYSDCSAMLNLPLQESGFLHLVTETVFYYDKLHLTEKIFKPIVARRPFMLVAAPGNLAYLKSYGFKTFDRWINESYDTEEDPDRRIAMIANEVERLCNLPESELFNIFQEMREILDYNFNHFYGNFKLIVINEMVTNFEKVIKQHNQGLVDLEKRIEIEKLDLPGIYTRLIK